MTRSRGGALWTSLGVIALSLVLFFVAATSVDGGRSPRVERSIFYLVNRLPDLFYWPLWVVMQLGNLFALPLAAVAAASTRRFRLAVAIFAMVPAKLYVARLVKANFDRERPASVIDEVIRRGDVSSSGAAFVSGHAIVVFALAALVTPHVGQRWRIAVWALAGLVCVGRVYVGAHLPLDVIGGAALGWALGSIANLVIFPPGTGGKEHEPARPHG